MWIFGWKGPSGFSARSTAEEVTHGIDGTALTAIVTGASSGIGAETTRVFALRGVHTIMAVRNLKAGRDVKEEITKKIPTAKIDVMELDLSSMASVRKFASDYISSGLPLNILINNAGILAPPFSLSKDNVEMQFATNHLGHFLLTNLLLDTMKKTSKKNSKEGRIVNVSSDGHRFTYPEGIRFDKINDESSYKSMRAYGQSKLANILHSNELARILKSEGANITANSVHPGAVATNILRRPGFFLGMSLSPQVLELITSRSTHKILIFRYIVFGVYADVVRVLGKYVAQYVVKTPRQGAATQCYVALHPQLKGVTGEYFADSNRADPSSLAKDTELAKKLWDFSFNLTKQKQLDFSISRSKVIQI